MKNLLRALALGLALILAALALTGCGGPANYRDGTYEGKSEPHEGDEEGNGDGYGVVNLTLKDNQIVDCTFATYDLNGDLKDENYGMSDDEVMNRDFYNKAQKAIAAIPVYAAQLVETGDIKKVDVISGATFNYNDFKDAVRDALNQARE